MGKTYDAKVIAAGGLQLPAGAGVGKVPVSDASGNLSLQVPAAATFTRPGSPTPNAFSGLTLGVETAKTVAMPSKTSLIYLVTASVASRLRLYATTAQAAADIARLQTVDPAGDHGCLLEVVFVAGVLTLHLAPQVLATDNDVTPVASLAANVRTDSGTAVTFNITAFALEA